MTACEIVPLITGYPLDVGVPGEQHRELAGASGAWSPGATCPTHPQPPRNGDTPLRWASVSWGLAAAASSSQPRVVSTSGSPPRRATSLTRSPFNMSITGPHLQLLARRYGAGPENIYF